MRQPRPNSLMKRPDEGEATKHKERSDGGRKHTLICIHPIVSCVGGASVHEWHHLILNSGG